MLKTQLQNRFALSNELYVDLVSHIPETLLASKLRDLPSNTIGAQLWCVVGARDSYLRAAQAGQWMGFKCPLDGSKTTDAKAVKESLIQTATAIDEYLKNINDVSEINQKSTNPVTTNPGLTESSIKFLLDLLEHEAQHHGQLARYLYGLKVGVPVSWKKRYNFD